MNIPYHRLERMLFWSGLLYGFALAAVIAAIIVRYTLR
jgi:hypothetical protein